MLDIHNNCEMDDVQFRHWMKSVTNLEDKKIDLVYDMLDYDNSGFIEFPEFYLIVCILLALNENSVKRFIYRHSKIVFELMDADGGGTISADEFARYGFLFSLEEQSVQDIFFEFDVSGDENLDYKEFKMFAMACMSPVGYFIFIHFWNVNFYVSLRHEECFREKNYGSLWRRM